jgi:dTDP-4-dehydrorhamnose 3,5-epimerase
VPFSFTRLAIDGLVLIEPDVFKDNRGFFMETYRASEFYTNGVRGEFLQDNHSQSSRGVLRGLHFQRSPHEQAKLVRVVSGCVWDVAVDLRPRSPTYSRWYGLELSAENRKMLFLPEGFANGFLALADGSELVYKCSAEYDHASEGGVRWDDPDLAINWPATDIKVSAKDSALPWLRDLS